MLVDLTVNEEMVKEFTRIAVEHNIPWVFNYDEIRLEKGFYDIPQPMAIFNETLDWWDYSNDRLNGNRIPNYGVADNLDQIKEFYKIQIEEPETKWVIGVFRIEQDKSEKGEGWCWHKWGEYIGKLNPQCEYLNDEDFGEDFEGVLCFHLYKVI